MAQIISVHRSAKSPPLFSHISAAVLLGLPIYGLDSSSVHLTTAAGGTGRPTDGVVRHRRGVDPLDVMEVEGIRCTTPDRTLFDLGCAARPEVSLSCADAFLSTIALNGRHVRHEVLAAWRERMMSRVDAAHGARGVRRLRRIVELADPRADSPLESVSRLQLHRLGFELDLQVRVTAPGGGNYYLDFEFLGLDLFGECDGKVKYRDPRVLAARTPEQVLYDEKRREDWVRGTTQKGLIRWDSSDAATVDRLGTRLRSFGVPLPTPRW